MKVSSARPGLVISTTLTGDMGSAWRIRAAGQRSTTVASVDAAVISRASRLRAGLQPRQVMDGVAG
jgi:hypothetical protein